MIEKREKVLIMTPINITLGLSVLVYVHAGYIQYKLFNQDGAFSKTGFNFTYLFVAPILLLAVSLFLYPFYSYTSLGFDIYYQLLFYVMMFPIILVSNAVYLFIVYHMSKSIAKIKQEQEQKIEELSDEKKNLS